MAEARIATIVFSDGMVGCSEWRHFRLTPAPDGDPVMLLQSLDEPTLSLRVAAPESLCPGYRPRLSAEDLAALGLQDSSSARLLCVLTTHPNPPTLTANLLGPIVVNPASGAARQVILDGASYPTDYPVRGDREAMAPVA